MLTLKADNILYINRFRLLVLLLVALCLSACTQSGTSPNVYSKKFKRIQDTLDGLGAKSPDYAKKYLDTAFRRVDNPTINDNFRRLSFYFAYYHKNKRDFKRSLVYADSMLNYVNMNGGQRTQPANFAEANFAKGDAFFELHDYNDAYRYYYYGYETGKNRLDNALIASYAYRMGMINYQQSNYAHAITFFKESFAQSSPREKDFGAFFRNQEVLDNIGLSYRHLDKTDSALKYFDDALKYIDERGQKKWPNLVDNLKTAKAVIQGNQADIYILRDDYQNATKLLKASIAVNLGNGGDKTDGMLSEIKLAKIYKEQKNVPAYSILLDSIDAQLQTITNNFRTIDTRKVEAEWYLLKSNLYEQHGNLDLALRYNQRYNFLKDSITESVRKLKEMSFTDKFDNYDKENQIETLKRYTRLQRIYLLVAWLAALLALAVIFMIYRNWRRSKKELMVISGLNNEISDQKTDLEETLEKLNDSNLEKDRILHTVAHDLRNPLGGISSLAYIMSEEECSPQQMEYVTLIKETADNSLQLISEIFEATDAGIGEVNLQPVDINTVLSNAVELLKFKAAEKNQQIILKLLPEPLTIPASREKLWRVVSNLIINAVKFSPVRTDILVQAKIDGPCVIISVADNGIGIPDDMKAKVFNMFTEAKRLGTMGEKSFGLGLSICRQIIEKHGGKLWLEDNPGGGSVFFISLKKA